MAWATLSFLGDFFEGDPSAAALEVFDLFLELEGAGAGATSSLESSTSSGSKSVTRASFVLERVRMALNVSSEWLLSEVCEAWQRHKSCSGRRCLTYPTEQREARFSCGSHMKTHLTGWRIICEIQCLRSSPETRPGRSARGDSSFLR